MTLKDSGDAMRTEIQWMKYGTVAAKDRSGAYLFLPGGEAEVRATQLFTRSI